MSKSKTQPIPPKTTFRNLTLLERKDQLSYSDQPTQTVPLDSIVLSSQQPRKYFDPDSLAQLAESIKKEGILQPLIIRCLEEEEEQEKEKYELVAGERRYRAASQIGLSSVPVIVKTLSSKEAQWIALTENLQREDLNPVEETEGILGLLQLTFDLNQSEIISLLNRLQNEESGKVVSEPLTHNVVSKAEIEEFFKPLGVTWQSFRSHRLPLLKLPPEILVKLREGAIAYTKAKAISQIKDQDLRLSFLEEAIAQNYSLSQIKAKISDLVSSKPIETTPKTQVDDLSQKLKQSRIWEDSQKWQKIKGYMDKIEAVLNSP